MRDTDHYCMLAMLRDQGLIETNEIDFCTFINLLITSYCDYNQDITDAEVIDRVAKTELETRHVIKPLREQMQKTIHLMEGIKYGRAYR